MIGLFKRIYHEFHPPAPAAPSESSPPLRIGVLGAANIAAMAIMRPAQSHPDVVVHAIAARDQARADAFASKWGVARAYGGEGAYQKLLDDPEIDVVYNPLPNALHYEWTMRALAAGKHVLLEKPSADTSDETRKMFAFAEQKGLVLLEAFHYAFHPAFQRAKAILDSGELGDIQSMEVSLAVPAGALKDSDIRFKYELGGGSVMDMGCYCLSIARDLAHAAPVKVLSASAETSSAFPKIDIGTTATLAFPKRESAAEPPAGSDAQTFPATLQSHFRLPPRLGFIPAMIQAHVKVTCERGELFYYNFAWPSFYHYISVKKTDGQGRTVESRTEKCYGEGEKYGWSTYRFQLEAFVDKVRGRTPQHWYSPSDSITNIEWIERIYEATDLGPRPASTAQVFGA
ncbi:NAD(P)-binding protein [Dentipellis sp. KUC8613]|nr:NAD(P)-binding protein [Dentipellis sp. KUC8613]